jgi:hypothetical protein
MSTVSVGKTSVVVLKNPYVNGFLLFLIFFFNFPLIYKTNYYDNIYICCRVVLCIAAVMEYGEFKDRLQYLEPSVTCI